MRPSAAYRAALGIPGKRNLAINPKIEKEVPNVGGTGEGCSLGAAMGPDAFDFRGQCGHSFLVAYDLSMNALFFAHAFLKECSKRVQVGAGSVRTSSRHSTSS